MMTRITSMAAAGVTKRRLTKTLLPVSQASRSNHGTQPGPFHKKSSFRSDTSLTLDNPSWKMSHKHCAHALI